MGRRTVLLVAALVVAALGTTMVFLYVNGVNDRAIAKQSPVRVLVAKKLIEPGTSIADANDAAAFERKTISSDALVNGAVSATTPLAGKVALTTIYPGEQIIAQKFGDSAQVTSLIVPDNKVSISVKVDDPAQTAGFVDAGSTVDIFLTTAKETRLLLPSVEVLAIGSQTVVPSDTATTSGAEVDPVTKTTLTLAVDQKDFTRVQFGSKNGTLSLGLPGKGFIADPNLPGTNQSNLFP